MIVARQAWAPVGPQVRSITEDSKDSISHPTENASPNLGLCHPTRPPVTRLAVAEAEQVITTTQGDHFSQAGDVPLTLPVVEDVKESAIEHGVERLTQINEAKSIRDDEARFHAPFGRLRPGELDGPHRHVDPHRLVTQ